MLRIKIVPLKPGVHEFELEPKAEDLDLDPACFDNIEVDARLDVYPERILVNFGVRADAALTCDRTLQPFTQHIKGTYTVLFARPEVAEAKEDQLEDVRVLLPSDTEIDLTEPVRDTLLLSVPVRRIAPGAEDEDIQTQFGAPPNGEEAIDPRWEALRRLQAGDD